VGDGSDEIGVNGIGSSDITPSLNSSPSFFDPEKVFERDLRDEGGEKGVAFA